MTFVSPLPWWVVLLALGAAGLLAHRAYARTAVSLAPGRRAALAGLRFGTFVLLITCLMRPAIVGRPAEARDAVVPILIDTSRSMRLADADDRPRVERAGEMVRGVLLPALGSEFAVEVLGFGDGLAPADPQHLIADGRQSDLAGAIRAARDRFAGRTIAGIVVVSDGGDTGAGDAAAAAAGGPPVYTVGIGARRIARDREVLSVTAAEAPFAESIVELAVSVVSHGFGSEPLELRVLENGQPIQVRRAAPPGDGVPVREVFRVSPQGEAATLYTVEIPPDRSELAPENNRRSVLVSPPGRPRRVLFVEGAPGFEHTFIKRAWLQDPGIEVDAVVRKGQNERGQDTFYIQAASARAPALGGGYPATREALFAYDAIVFGNVEGDFLTREQLAMTTAFVAERGGGLLVLGARAFARRSLQRTPLEEVLPVELADRGGAPVRASIPTREPHKLAPTAEGWSHPVMLIAPTPEESRDRWLDVPALASSAGLGSPRPGASILAVAAGPDGGVRPLVAVQRYGEGRSMIFGGEASWRWKMLRPSEDNTFDLFWRQAIRWLTAGSLDPVAMVVDAAAAPDEPVTVEVLARDAGFAPLRDAAVSVRVTDPAGETRALRGTLTGPAAGRYTAQLRAGQAGVYRVTADVRRGGALVGTAESWVLAGGSDPEFADPRLNEAVLRRVALASGGRLMPETSLPGLAELLRARAPEPGVPAAREIWNTPWVLILLVGLLSTEWGLRRGWGLR